MMMSIFDLLFHAHKVRIATERHVLHMPTEYRGHGTRPFPLPSSDVAPSAKKRKTRDSRRSIGHTLAWHAASRGAIGYNVQKKTVPLRVASLQIEVVNMELQMTDSAKIALRTLSARERDRLQGLFAALANWNNDAHIQKMSSPLIYKDVYVLRATDGMQIFFSKGTEKIVILDIARKKTVDQFAEAE
ncbi:MAG TPA: hypothetical protein VK395_06035 [Gemmataceae bacterium]|nr:hypothetical protein [Gemmataceae bacterium]